MEFVFECVQKNEISEEVKTRLRKIMSDFEVLANTAIPEARVHMSEEEDVIEADKHPQTADTTPDEAGELMFKKTQGQKLRLKK